MLRHRSPIRRKPVPRQRTLQLPGDGDRPIRLVADVVAEPSTEVGQRPSRAVGLAGTDEEENLRAPLLVLDVPSPRVAPLRRRSLTFPVEQPIACSVVSVSRGRRELLLRLLQGHEEQVGLRLFVPVDPRL